MKKDIAFIIYYPFQFYVYKNIYKHLLDRSIFIIDLYNFSEHDDINTFGSIRDLLEKNNIEYRIIKKEEYQIKTKIQEVFFGIDLAVSVWEQGCVTLLDNIDGLTHIKKVGLSYGVGKQLTMVRPSRAIYDLILPYGKSEEKYYSLFAKTIPIGNPKFDDFYENNLDHSLVENLKLNKNKKTVLYLPTHSNLGSFKQVMPELIKLKDKYNILIKIHYFIEREESEFISTLKLSGVHFLKDDTDLLPLLKVCDMAISDNSSVIFDVMQADKPLLLEDIWNEEFFEKDIHKLDEVKRGIVAPLTYPDSIEQRIKREGKVALNKNVKNLNKDIEYAISNDSFYSLYRKDILFETIEYTDGDCGKRGADAILGLLSGDIEPRKGIMYYRDIREKSLYQIGQMSSISKVVSGEVFDVNSIQYVIFCENIKDSNTSLDAIIDMGAERDSVTLVSNVEKEDFRTVKYLDIKSFMQNKKVLFLKSGVVVSKDDLSKIFTRVNIEDTTCISLSTKRKYSSLEDIFINLKLPFLKSLKNKNAYFTTDLFCNFYGFVPSEYNAVLLGETLVSELFKRNDTIKIYDSIIFFLNTRSDKIKILMLNIFTDLNFVKDSPELLSEKSVQFSFLQKYSSMQFLKDLLSDGENKKYHKMMSRLKIFLLVFLYRFLLYLNRHKNKLERKINQL